MLEFLTRWFTTTPPETREARLVRREAEARKPQKPEWLRWLRGGQIVDPAIAPSILSRGYWFPDRRAPRSRLSARSSGAPVDRVREIFRGTASTPDANERFGSGGDTGRSRLSGR